MNKSLKLIAIPVLLFTQNLVFGQTSETNIISNSGNVGIGTTNPDYKLEVHGTAKIDSYLIVKDTSLFSKPIFLEDKIDISGEYNERRRYC